MVVGRKRSRLDHEYVGAAHVLLNFDENFHVGKSSHDRLGEGELEIVADPFGQRGIRIAGDELDRSVLARHPEILTLTSARSGVVITRRAGAGNTGPNRSPTLSRGKMNRRL